MMNHKIPEIISTVLSIPQKQVEAVIQLLDEGSTIPFISRYRKEATGSLDEVQITSVKEQYAKLTELEKRRETILHTIEEQGKLTPELKKRIESTWDTTELEDIYLPYKPKKKTKASIAREKGLEPLAKIILKQQEHDIYQCAEPFVKDKVADIKEALQGARDIIAEWINENEKARNSIRKLFDHEAVIKSRLAKGKEEEGVKYKDYFNHEELLKKCPSHRFLAMMRGEKEGFLKVSVSPPRENAIEKLDRLYVKEKYHDISEQVRLAVQDAYKRLLQPSMENEFRHLYKEKADENAIGVFAENLRQLLLAPPLGQKRILALDPGFRTGCKAVCLDEQGNILHNATIYPHPPQNDKKQAAKKMDTMVESYKIDAISIGNGTAGRETEHFVKNLKLKREVQVFVVNEAGASVYSASPAGREEMPQYDVTVRGAASIGRRLMDPLAELVKIEPKSIGVGQYQHDVDQGRLKTSLDQVVESCVNLVGVNLNTASKHLLSYVSGLGPQLAQNIVDFRKENGAFASRSALKKVPRLGGKAFEQCAGFLRIANAKNPLDNSAVHPESYPVAEKMAKDQNCTITDLIQNKTLREKINPEQYITDSIGLPTLKDIMEELEKPGRDPRKIIRVFEFDKNIRTIEDLQQGMVVPGIVTNITNFGAFVDIGVKQDGLVHISNLKNEFVSNPADVVKLNEHVMVKVLDVDVERKRIQLSMKDAG